MSEVQDLCGRIGRILSDATKNVEILEKELDRELRKKSIQTVENADNRMLVRIAFRDALIANDVKFLLSRGVYAHDAFPIVASKRGVTTEVVAWTWRDYRKQRDACDSYAKRYMANRLKSAGYDIKEIARLLKVTQKHAYRLIAEFRKLDKKVLDWLGFNRFDDYKSDYEELAHYVEFNPHQRRFDLCANFF